MVARLVWSFVVPNVAKARAPAVSVLGLRQKLSGKESPVTAFGAAPRFLTGLDIFFHEVTGEDESKM